MVDDRIKCLNNVYCLDRINVTIKIVFSSSKMMLIVKEQINSFFFSQSIKLFKEKKHFSNDMLQKKAPQIVRLNFNVIRITFFRYTDPYGHNLQ